MGLQAIPWFTCVSIRLISSTKVYITIRCLREKERAFSLPVTNPTWASFLDFISSWSIAQHNKMIPVGFSLLLTIIWRALLRYLALSLVNSIFVAKRSTWLIIPSELTIGLPVSESSFLLTIYFYIEQTIS